MNMEQMQAAKAAMAEWLAHPQELGHEPPEIECAGTFELHEMTYYLFKYRADRPQCLAISATDSLFI